MTELNKFKELFWDAFHRPKLESEKFLQIWQELEPLNNYIAGPLFSFYENSNCDYIYSDNERFPSIKTADDFLTWMMELIEEYKAGVQKGQIENEVERKDFQLLSYQTDIKMQLADLAYQISVNSKQKE